jgi:hypothetical protein
MGVVSALWQKRERRFLPDFDFPIACGGWFEFEREILGVCSDSKKVCGVAQARVTSDPKVAGSNPAASES